MEEIREYIRSEGVTLTSQQINEVLTICSKYRISDFSSVINRLREVFTSSKALPIHDGTRNRYYVICDVCGYSRCTDKKKFKDHIHAHFNRMDDDLKNFIVSFNQRVLNEAVKIVRGETTLAGSYLSRRGEPGSMRTLITSCIPTATVDLDISYALFIAETGSPLSILNSNGFHRLLNDLKAQKNRFRRHHVVNSSIPKCVNRMKKYLTERLRGQTVCLVVDEMASFGIAYYNFIVCCRVSRGREKNQPGIFLWDSRILNSSTAEAIGNEIGKVADELMEYGIVVDSYVSDNCNAMKKSEVFAVTKEGKQLKRQSCGSHALNNIFKDFLSFRQIKQLWDNLSEVNSLVSRRRILSNELIRLQVQCPFEPIEFRPKWCCSFFDGNESMTTATLKEMNSTFMETMSSFKAMANAKNIEEGENVEGCSDDECIYVSDEESDDCTETDVLLSSQSPDKRPVTNQNTPPAPELRRYRSYRLRSFCVTRWYSAWLVMSRFYSLRHALRKLGERMEVNKSLCTESIRTKYKNALDRIDDEALIRVIHFLYPLVQGIDYCQRNDSMQLDILPMIESIRNFYRNHSADSENAVINGILDINYEDIDPLFVSRLSLFSPVPQDLRIILFDELYDASGKLIYNDQQLQHYLRSACDNIVALVDNDEALIAEMEGKLESKKANLINELKQYIDDKKYRITVHDAMRTSNTMYPILYNLYKYFINVPASSAAVERSFSFQNAILTPSRNRLMDTTVRNLLYLKMNIMSARKFGWEDDMLKFLNSSKDE